MHSSQIQKDLSIWKGNKQFTEQILISPFLNFVSWLFFQSSNSFYFIHPGNDGQTYKAWPRMLASTKSLISLAAAPAQVTFMGVTFMGSTTLDFEQNRTASLNYKNNQQKHRSTRWNLASGLQWIYDLVFITSLWIHNAN